MYTTQHSTHPCEFVISIHSPHTYQVSTQPTPDTEILHLQWESPLFSLFLSLLPILQRVFKMCGVGRDKRSPLYCMNGAHDPLWLLNLPPGGFSPCPQGAIIHPPYNMHCVQAWEAGQPWVTLRDMAPHTHLSKDRTCLPACPVGHKASF